jgi:magnesium transporter
LSAHLVDRSGATDYALDRDEIEKRVRAGEFFWLDLHRPSREDIQLLETTLGLHPLPLEDTEHFGQRAKCEDYDDFVFLVVFGYAPDEDGLVEVHCYYSERFLVTAHRDEAPAFAEAKQRIRQGDIQIEIGPAVLYHVLDALVDSFLPALTRFDDRLDLIDEAMFARPSDRHLQEIFTMKRRLAGIRRAIGPQRDLFAGLAAGSLDLPDVSPEAERYFRNIYDHLIRLTEEIDSQRDLMTGAIDVYMSTASNRLNETMKQLTLIATIFLPLTFITGFFGQNFKWLVDHVGGWPEFLGVGVGLELVALGVLLGLFKRRRWF